MTEFTTATKDVLSQSNASDVQDYNDLFDTCFILWIILCVLTTLGIFVVRGLLYASIKEGD